MNQDQLLRYSRQLPLLGIDGQKKLLNAHILIVGAGGLGCPAMQYLVAAGVGFIDVIDGDAVELSNLHRQILFTTADIGQCKASSAANRLQPLNFDCQLTAHCYFFDEDHAEQLVINNHLVIDASDNYGTRYLLNRICRKHNIPLVSASIFQYDAQISVFNYQQGPCYECLYPGAPPDNLIPNCAESGVLGVLPGLLGCMQATEAVKIITGIGEVLSGKLLTIDLMTQHYRLLNISKNPACESKQCSIVKAVRPQQETAIEPQTISAQQLHEQLAQQPEQLFLLDVRQPYERDIISIGGTLIPLAELEKHLIHIPHGKTIIVYCKLGPRSKKAAIRLLQAGFPQVKVLAGGVLQWANDIEKRRVDY